jgi:hypothetical protein
LTKILITISHNEITKETNLKENDVKKRQSKRQPSYSQEYHQLSLYKQLRRYTYKACLSGQEKSEQTNRTLSSFSFP